MAQLRDSIITGSLRVTDAIYSTTVQAQILKAPTASNGATYGPGTDKQVIRSNGTSSYWGSLGAAADYAIDDATSNGALGTGTGLTTERSVYYGLVTVNNASQTRATGIYAPTSAGTANQILVSSGGTSAPTWKATAAGAAYATSSNGALTFGTLGAGYGGTGQSTYTIGDILYSNAANTLAKLNGNTTTTNKFLRSVATTSGTAVAPTWSEVTKTDVGLSNVTNDAQVKASLGTTKGDMLYWTGNAAPARLGIGTAGYTLQATADGPAWTQTVAVANGGTGATSFTANCAIISGSTTTSALTTRAITNNTTATAVTASTNLITANTLYYHTGNSNLTTVGTITTGTWNATTIGAGYGGTGQSTYTVGDILYCGTANTLSKLGGNTTTTRKFLRSVATTSGTAVAPAWDTVTKTDVGLSNVTNDAQVKASLGTAKGDMLYWSASATPARLAIGTAGYFLKATANGPVWANTTDITALGTITTGTWNGSKIDVSYLSSSTANRLVWSQSTGTFIAGNHYASTTQVSIASTTAPDSEYALKVNGNLEAAGVINIITNTRTKDLYFSNGTPGSCGVAGRIMYDIGTGPNITKSLMCFVENSYSPTASATPIIYGEYYYLPACTAGLTQNLSYTILTTKSTVTTAQGGTGVASHTANRLVYSTSATTIQATDKHYASDTQISINSTTAPDSGYVLKVGGNLEIAGLTNVITNTRTKDYYFSNGVPGNCGVVGRLMYDVVDPAGITRSQFSISEYSYSSTASATPLSTYETYYLPGCTAGLTANVAYDILTTKNTVTVAQGGTGATSFTANCAIISGSTTTSALTTRAITNNTTATAVTASTNLITANTLYYHKGNSNIVTVGTITSGTWNGSTLGIAYGGTGQTTVGNAYMALLGRGGLPSGITSLDDIKTCGCYWINSTDCPNGWPASVGSGQYACVEVIGTGMPGVIVQRVNMYSSTTSFSRMWANTQWYNWTYNITTKGNNLARTIDSDLYIGSTTRASSVKLTRADKAVGFEMYEDFGRALTSTDYSVSQNLCGFLVHSYSTAMSSGGGGITDCNLSSYSENYYFPPANPDLTASVAYYILTTKQYPSAISGRAVPSGATFDTMTTAGVYNIANNCSGYPTTSGTNYNYGILLVATTASPNGSQSNMFQLYLGGTTNASYYKLWIRSRYNQSWKGWKQITLAS